jgi:type II secretory pathway pseudopilin PulG
MKMNTRASRTAPTGAGFSLVETVIVLTILVLLSAASVPMFQGIQAERAAREPLSEVINLAKQARLRAIREKRPYQVAFTQTTVYATRFFDPYLTAPTLSEFILAADTAAEAGQKLKEDEDEPEAGLNQAVEAALTGVTPGDTPATSTAAAADPSRQSAIQAEWVERYTLPQGSACTFQYWHEAAPMPIEGDIVKLWVFQPTGICDPIKLTLSHGKAAFAVEFSALTVDIVKEVSTY